MALAETLRTSVPPLSRTLVFGTTRDKDLVGQLRVLLPGTDRVIATRYVENPRSVPVEEVAEAVRSLGGPEPILAPDPHAALGHGAPRNSWRRLDLRHRLPVSRGRDPGIAAGPGG